MVVRQLEWIETLLVELEQGPPRTPLPTSPREPEVRVELDLTPPGDRLREPISRIVGVYQIVLRRTLEHFFPGAQLEVVGDRSLIDWVASPDEPYFRIHDDPSGLGVEIDWLGTALTFQSVSPMPLLPSERRMVEVIVEAIDLRLRGLINQDLSHRLDRFSYQTEDLIVADYLEAVSPYRVPAALEALRIAALSTYENRRVSMGVMLLGTEHDPAAPQHENREGAPNFNARLTAIKGFHRLCDGVRTVFLIDLQGDLLRLIDVARWADAVQGDEPLEHPCPTAYREHARATSTGGHVCLVLTPSQEIKVFARGTLAFSFSDARWRLLDIPSKFAVWCQAVGQCGSPRLAEAIFQAALNLSESRHGALFVVLRDPEHSVPQLLTLPDQISREVLADDPEDPDNLSPKHAKRSLHHVVRGLNLADIESSVLEAIASLDGAVVTDLDGRLLTFGAILRIAPETLELGRAVQGARTLAALAASLHGPVLKVSEDGYLTMFLKGRRVWEL
jgi:DNA integrity scanning protein DisA with diadenylate cyclase activity